MPARVRLLFPLVVVTLMLSRCNCVGSEAPPDECADETDCDGGAVCVLETDGHRACAAVCGAENPCPEGSACVEQDGTFGCLEITGDLELGEACGTDTECSSGACVGDDENGRFCAQPCTDDDGCPSAERCYVVDHRKVCLSPLDDRAAGEQCDTPRQCASARCVQVIDGEEAICLDGCVVDEGCSGPRNCVELDSGAHVCIDYVVDGTPCTTPIVCQHGRCIADIDGEALCTGPCAEDGSCADGWACVVDDDGAPVCMPLLDQRAAGEDCTSARECASGHCARFATETEDYGTLCADPCVEGANPDEQTCTDPELVCWQVSDGPDLCGPFPA